MLATRRIVLKSGRGFGGDRMCRKRERLIVDDGGRKKAWEIQIQIPPTNETHPRRKKQKGDVDSIPPERSISSSSRNIETGNSGIRKS